MRRGGVGDGDAAGCRPSRGPCPPWRGRPLARPAPLRRRAAPSPRADVDDLFQVMGDVEHCDAGSGQLAAPARTAAVPRRAPGPRSARRAARSLRADREGAGDLDDLALLHGQVAAAGLRGDRRSPTRSSIAGRPARASRRQPTAGVAAGAAEEHVLGHGQLGHDHRVLVHGGDLGAPGGQVVQRRGRLVAETGPARGPRWTARTGCRSGWTCRRRCGRPGRCTGRRGC